MTNRREIRRALVALIDHHALPALERAYRRARIILECNLVNWINGRGWTP